VELAQTRLRVGSGDLRSVLQQNVALSGARTSLVRIQAERLVQRVNLNLALGGSFEPRAAETATTKTGANETAAAVARR
jgi:outer membrane protein TolC